MDGWINCVFQNSDSAALPALPFHHRLLADLLNAVLRTKHSYALDKGLGRWLGIAPRDWLLSCENSPSETGIPFDIRDDRAPEHGATPTCTTVEAVPLLFIRDVH